MLHIGNLNFASPFIQAALSGYSDLPMRRLARRYGASYTLNEVILDKTVLQRGRRRAAVLNVPDDDHPVGGQLMGANPDDFAPAAAEMAKAGYDVIDINFGCPVRKVLGRCRGGFLLSQPETALRIIRQVFEAVGAAHPVTVKMRRGMDESAESERNFFRILDGAFEIGVSAVTVHARTVKQRYVGPSQWSFLKKVKNHAGNAVILGSGDLFSAAACIRMIEETGVDGVAIARGAIGNPWIFEECSALWSGKPLPPPPSIARQREAIARHLALALETYADNHACKIMRKFGIKYAEHHPWGRTVRDAFVTVKNAAEFQNVLDTYYDSSRDFPPVERREGHGDLIAAGASS